MQEMTGTFPFVVPSVAPDRVVTWARRAQFARTQGVFSIMGDVFSAFYFQESSACWLGWAEMEAAQGNGAMMIGHLDYMVSTLAYVGSLWRMIGKTLERCTAADREAWAQAARLDAIEQASLVGEVLQEVVGFVAQWCRDAGVELPEHTYRVLFPERVDVSV